MLESSAQLIISHFKVSILSASQQTKEILKSVDLTVARGQVHALMGPNGSGKSTLAAALAGHPAYQIDPKSVFQLGKQNLLDLSPDERSHRGLFLAFQYPIEVPGVKVQNFLRLVHQARFADQPAKLFAKVIEFRKYLRQLCDQLQINPEMLTRGLNEGMSGGEKKQLEILQMAVLEPKFAILDETDSGLDIDAIKKVAAGVKKIIKLHNTGILVITHYQRILDYLKPDFVHVLVGGKIVQSGDRELVAQLEKDGYQHWQGEPK